LKTKSQEIANCSGGGHSSRNSVMRLSNLVPERRLIQFVVVSAGGFAITTAAAAPFSPPPLSGCVH
jgi:hypothetical protein